MPIQLRVLNWATARSIPPANVPLVQYDLQVHFTDAPRRLSRRTRLIDFMEALDNQLDILFGGIFRRENVRPHDRIAIRIQFPSDFGASARKQGFFVIRRFDEDPVGRLFDLLVEVLQSEEALILALWLIRIQIIHMPIGMGSRRIIFGEPALIGKKSRVEIRNADNLLVCHEFN